MKLRILIILTLILVFTGSSAAMTLDEPASRTNFTATETLDPWGVLGQGPIGYFLTFGTLHCPSYPTPDPLGSCPPGSRNYRIGVKWVARLDSPDVRFNGPMTVEANLLWDENFEGRTWARYHVDVISGGTWDGQCQGSRRSAGDHFIEILNCSGRGSGGMVEGLHTNFTNTIPQYPSPVIFFVGNIEGTVINPNSN